MPSFLANGRKVNLISVAKLVIRRSGLTAYFLSTNFALGMEFSPQPHVSR